MCDKGCSNCGCTKTEIITKKGEKGLQGSQGPQGRVGAQGPTGGQGVPGNQGAQGIEGEPGAQGIQGDPGPGGVASSFDFSSGTTYNDPTPAVIFDVGWAGTGVSDVLTAIFRHDFGDMQVIEGVMKWEGVWNGLGSQSILVPIPGPALASYNAGKRSQIVIYNSIWNQCQSFIDTGSRLKFELPNSIPSGVLTTFEIRFSLLLLFNT